MHLLNNFFKLYLVGSHASWPVVARFSLPAALAAIYNVKINLSAIKDTAFVDELTREIEVLEGQVIAKEKEILAQVVV